MATQDIFFYVGKVLHTADEYLVVPYRCTVRRVVGATGVATHAKNASFTVKKGATTIGTLQFPNTTAMETAGVFSDNYTADATNGQLVLDKNDVLSFGTANANAIGSLFIELDPFARKA